MASACINNIGMSPENFLDCAASFPSYGWLNPLFPFSRELTDGEVSKTPGEQPSTHSLASNLLDAPQQSDPEVSTKDIVDFEFRLEDPVGMLPADELFSDGKLIPLQLSLIRPPAAVVTKDLSEIRSPDTPKLRWRDEISGADPYLFSPKAPRCSSRWKELLGLKRFYQNNNAKQDDTKARSPASSNHTKSLKQFLHRVSKSSNSTVDSSLSVPLLKDSDSESVSISSRLSLSSSSSGHEHGDLPRLSHDSDKPALSHIFVNRKANHNSNPPKLKIVKSNTILSEARIAIRAERTPVRQAPDSTTSRARGLSVNSPRMNSSGKIVFHSLERSSSSPSSNSGPRFKHRGLERSYSANVRVTPVLNVPVCSLRRSSKTTLFGFPLFSSPPQKREGFTAGSNGSGIKVRQECGNKNRTDRT